MCVCLSSLLAFSASELMCDFEDGLCSWTQDKEDIFDWTWNQGPTPTPNTGPFKDHTWSSVSGHYLYIESSAPQKFKDTAVLISRPFHPTVSKGEVPWATCVFRFHYHMLGQYIFQLAVYIRNYDSGRGQMLWIRHGDQGNLWHRKTLYISSARPFQVKSQLVRTFSLKTFHHKITFHHANIERWIVNEYTMLEGWNIVNNTILKYVIYWIPSALTFYCFWWITYHDQKHVIAFIYPDVQKKGHIRAHCRTQPCPFPDNYN